jgi:hypothetical protein
VRYWLAKGRGCLSVVVVGIEAGDLGRWLSIWGWLVDIIKTGPFATATEADRVRRQLGQGR